MHHQTWLPVARRRELDIFQYQVRQVAGFDRQQLAGSYRELSLIESQRAGVALPRNFATVDYDGPFIEVTGQRVGRRPRPAHARYHSSLSISGPAQSGWDDVAVHTVTIAVNIAPKVFMNPTSWKS
jgi:hypothetical protein